jgi:preprotein translocase subunit YajC
MFIASAQAQTSSGQAAGGDLFQIGFLVVLFGLFYFIAIRPQRKRQKEHTDMVGSLKKGDEVAMSSGMLGKVTALDDNYITLGVAGGLDLKFQRVHVNAILPKGTLKSVGTE